MKKEKGRKKRAEIIKEERTDTEVHLYHRVKNLCISHTNKILGGWEVVNNNLTQVHEIRISRTKMIITSNDS